MVACFAKVSDTEVVDSVYEAVQFIGKGVSNVAFKNVTSNSTGTFFLQLQCHVQASFEDTVAVANGVAGIYLCGKPDSQNITLTGSGNIGWNDTHCGFPNPPNLPS